MSMLSSALGLSFLRIFWIFWLYIVIATCRCDIDDDDDMVADEFDK